MIEPRLALSFFVFLLFLSLLSFNLKYVFRQFRGIKPGTLLVLAAIVALAVLVRINTPFEHRIILDEWEYMSTAKNILVKGDYGYCLFGRENDCNDFYAPFCNPGYPMLLSFFFRLAGAGDLPAIWFSFAVGLASIILFFALCFILLRSEEYALYASFVYALLPLNTVFSNSSATETTAVFFVMATLLLFLLHFRLRTKSSLYLAFASFVFMCYVRSENIILIAPVCVMLWSERGYGKKGWLNPAAFSLLILLPAYIIQYSKFEEAHSNLFYFLAENIKGYLLYWAGFGTHSVIVTALAVLGFFYLVEREKKPMLILAAWFLAYYLLFVSVGVRFDQRFSYRRLIESYPILAALAGVGVYALKDVTASKTKSGLLAKTWVAIALALILYLNVNFLEFNKGFSLTPSYSKNIVEDDYQKLTQGLNGDCYIVSLNSLGAFMTWEFESKVLTDRSLILDNRTVPALIKDGECVLYYTLAKHIDDYWIGPQARDEDIMLGKMYNMTGVRGGIGEIYQLSEIK